MFKKIFFASLFLTLPYFCFADTISDFEEWKKTRKPQIDAIDSEITKQKKNDQPMLYRDDEHSFEITLPVEWGKIPEEIIAQFLNIVTKEEQENKINYSAGFHLSEKEYFQYPYILIQQQEKILSYSELASAFSAKKLNEISRQELANPELLKNIEAESPVLDKDRGIIFSRIDMEVDNIGKINGLIAMFLGEEGVTQMFFYSTEEEYSQWLPIFNSIIDSFNYDKEFGFDYASYESVEEKSFWKEILSGSAVNKGIEGAIAGGFIGGIVALISFLKGRKERSAIKSSEKETTGITEKVNGFLGKLKLSTVSTHLKNLFLVFSIYILFSICFGGDGENFILAIFPTILLIFIYKKIEKRFNL
ncbi:MAG: hypothetical protein KAQ63_02050 [Candidatus Moranbacteria bacterium]|nr:hypothetical protein [Candidatus Moranbacteria bacterium]